MTKIRTIALLALITLALQSCTTCPGKSAQDEWQSLFNGKNLKGWIQKNGTATYRVEDRTIIGRTTPGSPNSFLCSEEEYGDFELEFEDRKSVV